MIGIFDDIDVPEGGFPVICADNPWEFKTRSKKGLEGRPQHYGRMTHAELCALPVRDLAAKDCHLFFWTTAPHLEQAFDVLRAWGFQYSSMGFVWVKLNPCARVLELRRLKTASSRETFSLGSQPFFTPEDLFMGQGYTTRKNAEYCLLGRRGHPKRRDKSVLDTIIAPVREHSRKPDEFFDRVVRYAAGPYLELFSRQKRDGWSVWGNEMGRFDDVC